MRSGRDGVGHDCPARRLRERQPLQPFRAATATAEPWDIWEADRIYEPLPPITWVVEGVIPAGSLGMICAYGSSLKSWIEIELLDALARNRPWLGLFPCASPGGAFLVDYEGGSYEVRRRLQAVARGANEDGANLATPLIRFVTMPPTFLPDKDFIARLEPIARECSIICIDTLSAGSPGVDENDARFAMPLNALKALAERTGCAIVVLHHTRKPQDGEDERASTRGTSAIFNALDWELKLSRSKDDERVFVCKATKARNMKAPSSFTVQVCDVGPNAVRVVGQSLGDCGPHGGRGAEQSAADRKRIAELEAEIVKAVLESKLPVRGLEALKGALRGRGVQFTNGLAVAALHNVIQSGEIVNAGTDNRPVFKHGS